MKKKFVIGITGGIGSGKSIVSDIIQNSGYTVIRSDKIARELMESDKKLIRQIKNTFSEDAYVGNKLNVDFLSRTVFSKPKFVKKINSLVHPLTIKKIKSHIKKHPESENAVFVESALIFEAKIEQMFDYILLVYSNRETRIKRAVSRDGLSKSQVLKRMKMQMPDGYKKSKSDFIIDNNSTVEELHKRTSFILNVISDLILINTSMRD